MTQNADAFIRANTAIARPPLVPEIRLHLASEITPIWQATEADLDRAGLPPPFWAFCWPGGQVLARYLLDRPETVHRRRVLDFAAGCGIAAIAAAKAGADQVTASEIDAYALAAIRLNAALNGAAVAALDADLTGREPGGWDVVLAGDICYERPMAEAAMAWLRASAASGSDVLLGDPGRTFLPADGLAALARYDVPTTRELEDRDIRTATVWRVTA